MSNCMRCSYPKGEPKGARLCKRCQKPENVSKADWKDETPETLSLTLETEHITITGQTGVVAEDLGYLHPLMAEQACVNGSENPNIPLSSSVGPTSGPVEILSVERMSLPDAESLSPIIPPSPPLEKLPAHSVVGGSAAHRFLNCTGSTALIRQLKIEETDEADDPDWRRDGVQAHEIGARCLDADMDAWELVHEYSLLDPLAAAAVQVYVDYVRSLPGRRRVEVKIHLPELHPAMFSTLDAVLTSVIGQVSLRVVDYKHGEGIFVEVANNEQLMYYAAMAIMENPAEFDDEEIVELVIVQPRIPWAEPVRTWWLSVGAIKKWLYEVLLPAMRLEAKDMHLQMGEWCRFCPAKLVCPAMTQAFATFSGATNELAELSNEVLGRDYVLTATVQMRINAIKTEVKRRLLDRIEIPGAKLVSMRADRVFKDKVEEVNAETGEAHELTVEQEAMARFGTRAYTPATLLSPAQMEKLPGGKDFVAEWAYKPEVGYTTALLSDKRAAVVLETLDEKYGPPERFAVDIVVQT